MTPGYAPRYVVYGIGDGRLEKVRLWPDETFDDVLVALGVLGAKKAWAWTEVTSPWLGPWRNHS